MLHPSLPWDGSCDDVIMTLWDTSVSSTGLEPLTRVVRYLTVSSIRYQGYGRGAVPPFPLPRICATRTRATPYRTDGNTCHAICFAQRCANHIIGGIHIETDETARKLGMTAKNRGGTRASDPEPLRKSPQTGPTPLPYHWSRTKKTVIIVGFSFGAGSLIPLHRGFMVQF